MPPTIRGTPTPPPSNTAPQVPGRANAADFSTMMKTIQRHALDTHNATATATEHALEHEEAEKGPAEPETPPSRVNPFKTQPPVIPGMRGQGTRAAEHMNDTLAELAQLPTLPPEARAAAHMGIAARLASMPNSPDKTALLKQLNQQIGALPTKARGAAMAASLAAMQGLSPDDVIDPLLGFFEGDEGGGGDGNSGDGGFSELAIEEMDVIFPELTEDDQSFFLTALAEAAPMAQPAQISSMVAFASRHAAHMPYTPAKLDLLRQITQQLNIVPAKAQAGIWSSLVTAAGTVPGADRSDLVDALIGGVEYARNDKDAEARIGELGAMVSALPPHRRLKPLKTLLNAAPIFGKDVRMAIHTASLGAGHGLPPDEHKKVAEIQDNAKGLITLAPAQRRESGITQDIRHMELPNPWQDGHAFAEAVETNDRIAAGEDPNLVDSGLTQQRARERAAVIFSPPGLPSFREPMDLLAKEHMTMLRTRDDYRQAVGDALRGGPVRVSMSPQYPWPASCDQDSLGQHLISLNPNMLGTSTYRLAAALAAQMREAAAAIAAGCGTSLTAMRYHWDSPEEEDEMQGGGFFG